MLWAYGGVGGGGSEGLSVYISSCFLLKLWFDSTGKRAILSEENLNNLSLIVH